MGSKKKRNASSNKKTRSSNVDAVRKAQPDMSKYAGAVSNKSKRNYADLKLVRPDNLADYASGTPSRKRSAEGSDKSAPPRSTGESRSSAKRKSSSATSQSVASRAKKSNGNSGKRSNQVSSAQNKASSKSQKMHNSSQKSHATQRESAVEYKQDEYSKALNSSDFYSSVVEKYYIKHPEEQEKREKSGVPRRKKNSQSQAAVSSSAHSGKRKSSQDKPSSAGKSVAEMAVRGRGSIEKKNRAKVVKGGKAKGVVPTRAMHRRVTQRNRHKTAVFNSVIVLATVVVLVAVYVSVFFNVKKIEVRGESPYSANQVIDMCNFTKGDNILFVDAEGSEREIVRKLPYIESCTVKRKLPATVVVNVTEVEILGVAEIAANCWAAISTKGKILDTVTNSAVVSSSDALVSLTYDAEAVSARAVAEKRGLPVLEGIDFKNSSSDGYIQGDAAKYLADFEQIYSAGQKLGMKFTRLRYGDRGYEAEYDSRINIVLGDISDKSTMLINLKKADHILKSGNISEYERGEIKYIKNETFYSPTYETEEEDEVAPKPTSNPSDSAESQNNAQTPDVTR